MKILITGAYGIVGSHLCKELKKEHEIIGIGRRENYDGCHKYYCCDITDKKQLEEGVFSTEDLKWKVLGINSNGDLELVSDSATNNELYIDPLSPIFNVSSNENLNCVKDGNNNINYIAIIPYLIAEIQKLRITMKNAGIYQDLSDLTVDEFYNEIFKTLPPNNTDELGFE